MDFGNVILLENVPIVGGETGGAAAAPAQAATTTQQAAPAPEEGSGGGFFSGGMGLTTILLYAALIGALYFFMIRPQKKREAQIKEMQESLKVGDSVMTTSGMFGTIASVGDDCFVVEFGTNKGIRIPVRKADIAGVKAPTLSVSSKDLE